MITEEDLLSEIRKGVETCKTLHLMVLDSSVSSISFEESPEELLNEKNLAWIEPKEGVYLINTHFLTHFKKNLNNVRELHQELVDCGYIVKSKRFGDTTPKNLFNFKEKKPIHIAIVTMFSDKGYVGHWKNFLNEVIIPEGVSVDVILGDNSDLNNIKILHSNVMETYGNKFNEYYIAELGDPYKIKQNEHYLQIEKHVHVAVTYSKFLREIASHYDYILKIEDDMEPPSNGLEKLYKHIKDFEEKKCKIACVAGYYRQKMDPLTTCISMQPEIWGKIPKIDEVKPRLFRVEMQGGGFALYNCKAIKDALPYKLTFKMPNGHYYMTGWDGTMGEYWAENGWQQYCDGSLFCEHHF